MRKTIKISLLTIMAFGMNSLSFASEIIEVEKNIKNDALNYRTVSDESSKILLGSTEFIECQEKSKEWNDLGADVAEEQWRKYLAKEVAGKMKNINESVGKKVGEFYGGNFKSDTIKRDFYCGDRNQSQYQEGDCTNVKKGMSEGDVYIYKHNANIKNCEKEPAGNSFKCDGEKIADCTQSPNHMIVGEGQCIKYSSKISESPKHFLKEKDLEDLVDNMDNFYALVKSTGDSAIGFIKKCIAYQAVMSSSRRDRNMSVSDDNKTATTSSFDKKVKCEAVGYETQDYVACKKAVTAYDIIFIGRKAVETVQGMDYMDETMDIQTEMAKNAQTDAAAGLKAQKKTIEKKAEMARVRAASETAAAAVLATALYNMPNIEKIKESCDAAGKSVDQKGAIERIRKDFDIQMEKIADTFTTGDYQLEENSDENGEVIAFSAESNCQIHIGNLGNGASHAMVNNEDAKEGMQQALIDAGMQAVTMLGTAEILDKQAGRVGDAIKGVQDHEPESLAYDGEDILATECQLNPGADNCVNAQFERGVDYYDQGINVDGMQFATSDATQNLDDPSQRSVNSASDATSRQGAVGGLGDTINGVEKGSGLADAPAGAASIKASGTNGIGSGGGGGGAGGGGASAPSNGSAKSGGGGGSKPYVGSSKKLGYSGGGGSLSYRGGSKRTRKAKSANPFANLFGKKGKKKGGVMNFRGMASKIGPKNGSIFNMISKRYSSISKDERLEEYKKVNGDLR
ncbi:hypothetical protein A9Q84_12600 [Halobacteriovorax marinus]|uniref:Uncharacterized protein n=1 Tax=Halobacteriovorax marinus TaxID=97084 RepID=A0A1Y5FE42_9BACT|nr:hypothetical protein A9Q84_12600 [Halobacteriovorax marinus]